MIDKIRNIFVSKDDAELKEAKDRFDDLMKEVDSDEMDIRKLERQVQDEFDELGDDVDDIRRKVDQVIEKKAA